MYKDPYVWIIIYHCIPYSLIRLKGMLEWIFHVPQTTVRYGISYFSISVINRPRTCFKFHTIMVLTSKNLCTLEFRLKTCCKFNISYITDAPENQYGRSICQHRLICIISQYIELTHV